MRVIIIHLERATAFNEVHQKFGSVSEHEWYYNEVVTMEDHLLRRIFLYLCTVYYNRSLERYENGLLQPQRGTDLTKKFNRRGKRKREFQVNFGDEISAHMQARLGSHPCRVLAHYLRGEILEQEPCGSPSAPAGAGRSAALHAPRRRGRGRGRAAGHHVAPAVAAGGAAARLPAAACAARSALTART